LAKIAAILGPVPLGQYQEQKVPVLLLDETDLVTPETGVASPTIQISKNGAAFANPSLGTWTEVGSGYYTVTLNDTDTNTLGFILIRVIKAGVAAESTVLCLVGISPAEMRSNFLRVRKPYER